MFLKIAMETTLFGRLPLEKALEVSAQLGLKDVEIGLSHFDACRSNRADFKRIRALLSDYGLEVGALFALGGFDPATWSKFSLGFSSPTESDRKKAVNHMKNAISLVGELDCRLLASELSGDRNNPQSSLKSFQKSMEEIIPHLESNDVSICFEAHPGDFIEDSFEAVKLIRSFGSKHMKYNYCVPHTFVLRHEPKEILDDARDVVAYVHLADTLNPQRIFFCPTYSPEVMPHLHLTPGEGDIDFGEVFSNLRNVGFDGIVSICNFSHMDHPTEAATEAVKQTREMLR
jgi:myo-inositol catabolism protein IolH